MPTLRSRVVKLALDDPELKPHLARVIQAAEETDEEGKFERGEDVPLSKMPKKLQDNAKNPPPSVQKVKERIKERSKKAHLDDRTLGQLVEMAADSMELPRDDARVTRDVEQKAKAFERALAQALAVWVQKYPPEDGSDVDDVMDEEAGYLVYMTLDEQGVGIWDGRWDRFYSDTKKLEQYLTRALDRSYRALRDAINDAAYETAGEGD